MKDWYSTREGANIQHKSQPITNGKRIFLSEAQAKLHGDAIEKSEAPQTADEAGIKAEFEEWTATQPQKSIEKSDADLADD